MTSLRSASTARRRRAVAAVGAVGAGLLVLSACDKPTPISTITVGRSSVNSEASCYDDGKELKTADVAECLKDKDIKSIKVDPEETVRFGVDPDIADKGWTIPNDRLNRLGMGVVLKLGATRRERTSL